MLHALRHTHRQWMSWAIALIVLLGALAPTVSRWVHASSSLPLALMEVCATREAGPSTLVLKQAPLTRSDSGWPASPHDMDHCPFCVLQGDGHALPPPVASIQMPSPSAAVTALPHLFLHAPRPLHAWAMAPARAPPLLTT
ncbi:MAG: DUF2946 family protein [Aquabacterium sp.]